MPASAIETLSTFGIGVLCLVIGIMMLALFFTIMNRIGERGAKAEAMTVRGVLRKDSLVTVYTTGAETFEQVRFLGYTSTESIKTHLPPDLYGMVILEDASGNRFLIRAKAIRMIVIASADKEGEGKKKNKLD